MRREFSRRLRAEIVHRSMNAAGQVVCEGCGFVLAAKRYEIDHVIAEALIVDKTKSLTAADGQLLGVACCHRGGQNKTAEDVGNIARAVRREAKDKGFQHKVARPMNGSRASPWKAKIGGGWERRT